MTPSLSTNTKAILLLTAPLMGGGGTAPADLLTPGEYKRLARHLRELQRQPADLLSPDAEETLRACQPVVEQGRLQRLLERGMLLGQAIERWQARAIWVVSRADAEYPRRWKARLREDAPAVLYGCGEVSLLESGGLAVVGSRNVDDALVAFTLDVGRLAAQAGRTIVSGGARGIDQSAMRGALEAGGKVSGVLADSLERAAMNRENRDALLAGQLVLVSPYDPSAGFHVGNAMQRNKMIYALSDASLVVSSDLNKGGTWAGATEQLDKLRLVPVYVRTTGPASPGLTALLAKGGLPWPSPADPEAFRGALAASAPAAAAPDIQGPATGVEAGPSQGRSRIPVPPSPSGPAQVLFQAVREAIRQVLTAPMKESDIAGALDLSISQSKVWLQRLVDSGDVTRTGTSPVRYALTPDLTGPSARRSGGPHQLGLGFEPPPSLPVGDPGRRAAPLESRNK
jgi:DNA processing protein